MAAEIVAAQARRMPLSSKSIVAGLRTIFQTLQSVQQSEQLAAGENVGPRDPLSSIQHRQIVCLECGMVLEMLSPRHLALHGLTSRAYKLKHGIPLTQALSARTLSERRRKLARERGMGQRLLAWRARHKRQTGS
jgi:predicted transcriptional regulator